MNDGGQLFSQVQPIGARTSMVKDTFWLFILSGCYVAFNNLLVISGGCLNAAGDLMLF